MTNLSPGWVWTTLDEIALSVKNGIFISRPGTEPNGVPILRISAVRELQLNLSDIRYSGRTEEDLAQHDALALGGDILFTRYNGNPDYVGVGAWVPPGSPPLTFPDKLIRVRLDKRLVDPQYVACVFAAPSIRAKVRAACRTTAGQVGISGSSLRGIRLPLPPLNEQRRIAAVVEDHLSSLAHGSSSLDKAALRTALLRKAITDDAASGRILSGGNQCNSPEELTSDWRWVSPEELTSGDRSDIVIGPFGSDLKVTDYRHSGVPLIFVRDIRARRFGGKDPKFISTEKALSLQAHKATKGDILITKMGDPPGDACVYDSDKDGIITADCIRLRPSRLWDPEYLALASNSSLFKRQINNITRGVAQQKVSLARFRREMRIPVPPVELQNVIINAAKRYISAIESLEEIIVTSHQRRVSLSRSLLAAAVAGRLVNQDPVDEPASVLLERVRAQSRGQGKGKGKMASLRGNAL